MMLSASIALRYFSDKIYKIARVFLVAFTRHEFLRPAPVTAIAAFPNMWRVMRSRAINYRAGRYAINPPRVPRYYVESKVTKRSGDGKESMLKYRFDVRTVSLEKSSDETLGTPAHHTSSTPAGGRHKPPRTGENLRFRVSDDRFPRASRGLRPRLLRPKVTAKWNDVETPRRDRCTLRKIYALPRLVCAAAYYKLSIPIADPLRDCHIFAPCPDYGPHFRLLILFKFSGCLHSISQLCSSRDICFSA